VVLASALEDKPLGARRLLPGEDREARRLLQGELPERSDGLFLEPFPRLPELLVFGGSHIAIPLTRLATAVGFRVSVIDARSKFADPARFPDAQRVVRQWPDEFLRDRVLDSSTYIVILTHDPKFDDPIIKAALRGKPRYIGAIGSRKTHRERVERLVGSGVSREALASICAPIGLDIGARTAEETALSILAQLVAVRHGRQGGPMPGGS
jgi:xanthine dehydrogenase accessory factor